MSEAWDDLGSREKLGEVKEPEISSEARSIYEKGEILRMKNKEILKPLKARADLYEEKNGMIQVRIEGRKFDFWPSTDCWFSYAKSEYGTGIEWLSGVIRKRLLQERI